MDDESILNDALVGKSKADQPQKVIGFLLFYSTKPRRS